MNVLLCVGGGIAAYKSCEVARLFVKGGASVRCALTRAAQEFVTPLSFQALTSAPVATSLFDAGQELAAGHISLADWADVAVIAPATADLIARLSTGLADDIVTATLLAIEPSRWVLAPAMNERMWASPAVAGNMRVLRERGVRVLGPAIGEMAERSHSGPGRMVEAAEIVAAVLRARDLEGESVLVTAGPTREALDPVRFLSNPSSGRMGFAMAEAARDRGAVVTLIAGPTEVAPPSGVRVVRITSADELAAAVAAHVATARVVVMAAAVSDQKPAERAPQKVKKPAGDEIVRLVRTPDILAGLGALAQRPLLIGFAAETERVEEHAREKLARKNADYIVANDVSAEGEGFAAARNRVVIFGRDGTRTEAAGTKLAVAHAIWDCVAPELRDGTVK